MGGGITAGVGFGDEGEDALRGVHGTVSAHNVGYDIVGQGPTGSIGAGLEYFQQTQGENKRLGFRAGLEGGGLFTPVFDAFLVGGTVGVRWAFTEGSDFPFFDLGGIVGAAADVNEDVYAGPGHSGIFGVVGLSVGWLSVRSLRL